jgi:hypothetical protein
MYEICFRANRALYTLARRLFFYRLLQLWIMLPKLQSLGSQASLPQVRQDLLRRLLVEPRHNGWLREAQAHMRYLLQKVRRRMLRRRMLRRQAPGLPILQARID